MPFTVLTNLFYCLTYSCILRDISILRLSETYAMAYSTHRDYYIRRISAGALHPVHYRHKAYACLHLHSLQRCVYTKISQGAACQGTGT